MADTQRYHGLDALRAVMLLLGIVLHAGLAYFPDVTDVRDSARWYFYDDAGTWLAPAMFVPIHLYRMPVFFVLAGFFAALLIQKRTVAAMFANRISRIAVPLILAYVTLIPLLFLAAIFANHVSIHDWQSLRSQLTWFAGVGQDLHYLWFLWHLLVLCSVTAALGRVMQCFSRESHVLPQSLANFLNQPLGIACVLAATFGLNLLMKPCPGFLEIDLRCLPQWYVLAYHSLFFFVGIAMYQCRETTLERLSQHAKPLMIWAVGAVTVYSVAFGASLFLIDSSILLLLVAAIATISVWLAIFGCIGVAIRFGQRQSAVMRYLADSSYWVYLAHMPVLFLFHGMLASSPLGGPGKWLAATLGTILACVASYELMVRYTWVGQILNGRKYQRPHRLVPGLKSGHAQEGQSQVA